MAFRWLGFPPMIKSWSHERVLSDEVPKGMKKSFENTIVFISSIVIWNSIVTHHIVEQSSSRLCWKVSLKLSRFPFDVENALKMFSQFYYAFVASIYKAFVTFSYRFCGDFLKWISKFLKEVNHRTSFKAPQMLTC